MIKSIYFPILIIIFSLSLPLGAQQEQTSSLVQEHQTIRDHLAQEKKAIMLEMKLAINAYDRAIIFFENALGDSYIPQRKKCIELLAKILATPEFTTTVEQVTDAQAKLIIKENTHFNEIFIDP